MRLQIYILWIFFMFLFVGAQAQTADKKGLISEALWESPLIAPQSLREFSAIAIGNEIVMVFSARRNDSRNSSIFISRIKNAQLTVDTLTKLNNDPKWFKLTNPVLAKLSESSLLLFFKSIDGKQTKTYLKRSEDGGKTWSAAEALWEGIAGPSHHKPLLVNDLGLVSPTYTSGNGGFNNYVIHVEWTKDKGHIWDKSNPVRGAKDINGYNPVILDHGKGKLELIAPSLNKVLLYSWSYDAGKTWWPLTKTELPNNNTDIDAIKLQDDRFAMLYSHTNKSMYDSSKKNPLNLALSKDGVEWQAALKLEESNEINFTQPQLLQTKDGNLHALYILNYSKIKEQIIYPKQLKLKKMKDGEWPD